MALCRCKNHGYPKGKYFNYKEPLLYPNTSSICGSNNCVNSGLIWLTKEELIQYEQGERIFSFASSVTKVKVK